MIDQTYAVVIVNNNGWLELYRNHEQVAPSLILHETTCSDRYNEYLHEVETAGWQLVDYLPDGDGAVYEREVSI